MPSPSSEPLANFAHLSLSDRATPTDFFDPWIRHNGFLHDPNAAPTAEFDRLASHMNWQPGTKGYSRRRGEFLAWDKEVGGGGGEETAATEANPDRRRDYFDEFREGGFVHDPRAPIVAEFRRLAGERGWAKGSRMYNAQQAVCFVTEFEAQYGNKSERLEGWRRLCRDVGVDPIPESIRQCRKELRKLNVNIVDLVDARRLGRVVRLHASRDALRRYSRREGKIFSLEAAKRNGFLTALLIEMMF